MLNIRKKNSANTVRRNQPTMGRKWVETGDARCPIACVWFALGRADAVQSDLQDLCESDRPWPALFRFKLNGGGRAFSSLFHSAA
ncbi:MAG TPA: hypothetical protein VNU94_04285 [Acidobacteriaceae bacterium]|jgi:hypothetical protein|nr:hypothetical protein [Acidobacteriaceae bacterium]